MPPSSGAIEVLIALDESTGRDEVLKALMAHPDFDVRTGSWPGRDTSERPAVIVGPIDPPEPITALRERLGGGEDGLRAVVLIASDPSVEAARRSLVLGADVVLLQKDVGERLAAAIRAAVEGLLVLSHALGYALERPALTTREKQILALVIMGMSNQEIADRLVLAESTVKSHLFSAYRRLGVRGRREAVTLIMDPQRGLGSGILGLTEN